MNPLQEATKNARKVPSNVSNNSIKNGGDEAAGSSKKTNQAAGKSTTHPKTMSKNPISYAQQQQKKQQQQQQILASPSATAIKTTQTDENLPKESLTKDPRDPLQRIHRQKQSNKKKGGRNTESFNPESTLVRPDLRVQIGSPNQPVYRKPLKHDDVVIVPELFGPEDDWSLYYKLVQEITDLQQSNVKGSEWISWHERGALDCQTAQRQSNLQQDH